MEPQTSTPTVPFSGAFTATDNSERYYPLPFADRQGSVRVAITDDVVLVDSRMMADKPAAPWQHVNDQSFVELNFMVTGSLYQTHSGLFNRHQYAQGYHNWLFNPQSWEQNELIGAGQFRVLAVHIRPARMVQLLTNYVPELLPLAEKIEQGMPFVCHAPGLGFSPRLAYVLDTLWDSPQPAGLKRLHYESVMLELFGQQCDLLLTSKQVSAESTLKLTERDKLYQARAILLHQLNEPPSMAELARDCQLNEFSLKRGFRQLFGTSVFGFVQEQRLDTARHLLYGGGKTVSEIAYELGYAHPQHFHRAFKKRFGVTPKQLTE